MSNKKISFGDGDDKYFIHFDSIGSNAYNLYFYYTDLENNKKFDIINIDSRREIVKSLYVRSTFIF